MSSLSKVLKKSSPVSIYGLIRNQLNVCGQVLSVSLVNLLICYPGKYLLLRSLVCHTATAAWLQSSKFCNGNCASATAQVCAKLLLSC